MNIKNRLSKIEAARHSQQAQTVNDERYGINLNQWRRLIAGEDISPEIAERNRPAFLAWRERCAARRRQATVTTKMFN